MRTNHILIDFENLQPASLAALEPAHFRVMIFLGANQSRIPLTLAQSVQKLGDRAAYVQIAGQGSNALDFHIAYYIGRLSREDPSAWFHIISKDTGFDPLIQHLKAQKVNVARAKDLAEIAPLKAANSKTLQEKVGVVIGNLRQRGAAKPRTVKTLSSTISSLFQKQLPDDELGQLLAALQSMGAVVVTDSKVSYALPEASG